MEIIKTKMIDPETKKYIDDIVGMQNIKVSSLIASIFEILEEKKIANGDDWDKALEKERLVASLAMLHGIDQFTRAACKQAEENEDLR